MFLKIFLFLNKDPSYMSFVICPISVVPIRSSASDKSEQVSQLLFGEMAEILERKGQTWVKVRCDWDNYIGWVATHQLQAITPSELKLFRRQFAFNLDLLQPVISEEGPIPIPLGARLPTFDGMKFELAGKRFLYSGQGVFPENIQATADMAIKIARRYLFAPYQHGGRSPLGIDSAGLSQMVFQLLGIQLEREAAAQVLQGETVDFVEQAAPGDLAFFENRKGRVDHVGMILPDNQILHAFGRVRIDQLDHYGIFDESAQKYTHNLRIIRRMLPAEAATDQQSARERSSVSQQFEIF